MKALTDVATFDRVSTREELKQVLDLLSDVEGIPNTPLWDLPGMIEAGEVGPPDDSWADLAGSEEHAELAELATLANMFLERHGRAN